MISESDLRFLQLKAQVDALELAFCVLVRTISPTNPKIADTLRVEMDRLILVLSHSSPPGMPAADADLMVSESREAVEALVKRLLPPVA